MDTLQQLRHELTAEYNTTKAFLEAFPEGKKDYRPHEKSTKLGALVEHIVEIFGWPAFMLQSESLDLADGKPGKPKEKRQEFLDAFEKNYQESLKGLTETNEAELDKRWKLQFNGNDLAEWSKYGAIRHSLNQVTHHRAQLGTYYRLNDIPLPPSYGPTADVNKFQ